MLSRSKEKVQPLPLIATKEGDYMLKDMDFSKAFEKILRNIDMRRQ
jgi:hypothetical protein